jgi:hypothetical protein
MSIFRRIFGHTPRAPDQRARASEQATSRFRHHTITRRRNPSGWACARGVRSSGAAGRVAFILPTGDPAGTGRAGSHKVEGLQGPGTGFLIKATASFVTSGPDFEIVKSRFAWARATLALEVASATQTL